MDVENARHNLTIIGKIFLILGLVIVPLTILCYNSIHFFLNTDWFHWGDHVSIGILRFRPPLDLFYVIPIIYGLFAILLIMAGIGLIYDAPWGKKLALAPAVLLLFKFPVGTALGLFVIYLIQQEKGQMQRAGNGTGED